MHTSRHKCSVREAKTDVYIGTDMYTFRLIENLLLYSGSCTLTHRETYTIRRPLRPPTSPTYVAASLQGSLCVRVAGAGMGRRGAAGWMRHHGFGVDTSEACRPARPSPALSGSDQ